MNRSQRTHEDRIASPWSGVMRKPPGATQTWFDLAIPGTCRSDRAFPIPSGASLWQVAAGCLLLSIGAITQSIGLLGLGLVLLCGPWVRTRARR
jgi:hypothetical protein